MITAILQSPNFRIQKHPTLQKKPEKLGHLDLRLLDFVFIFGIIARIVS